MSNEEMLELVRADRPSQVINEVLSFEKNKYGFYNVKVDMESMFFNTKILHTQAILPYPALKYAQLSEDYQFDWRWDNK